MSGSEAPEPFSSPAVFLGEAEGSDLQRLQRILRGWATMLWRRSDLDAGQREAERSAMYLALRGRGVGHDVAHQMVDDAIADHRPTSPGEGPRPVRLSSVAPEEVRWLWEPRIPLGKVTIIEGHPDEGKSTLLIDLAARITKGLGVPLAAVGAPGEPAGVVLVTAEDGLADTILPRLEAAGGDPSRVLAYGAEELPEIPGDLSALEEPVRRVNAKLVIIDPLMAVLSGVVDAYKDHHVRRALAPLAAFAARLGVAVVVVRHLTKGNGTDPKTRGSSSIAFTGAARSVLLCAPHPDRDGVKVLARVKGNLGPPWKSLAYRVVVPDGGRVPRIEWLGPVDLDARTLLAAQAGGPADARQQRSQASREVIATAVDALTDAIEEAGWRGEPLTKGAAVELLMADGLTRQQAREEIASGAGSRWEIRQALGKGGPLRLYSTERRQKSDPVAGPCASRTSETRISAEPAAQGRQKSKVSKSLGEKGVTQLSFLPPEAADAAREPVERPPDGPGEGTEWTPAGRELTP